VALDTGFATRLKRLLDRAIRRGFPWKVFYRFILVQALLAVAGLALVGVASRYYFKRQFIRQVRSSLQDTMSHLALEFPEGPGREWCGRRALGTELRLALIKPDGTVHCDSRPDPEEPEVMSLPEVQQARQGALGQRIREGGNESVFIVAQPIGRGGWIVRVVAPLNRLSETMRLFDTTLLVVLVLMAGVLVGLAFWSARRLVFPLRRLVLKTQNLLNAAPSELLEKEEFTEETFDEWLELESNIDSMRKDLVAKTQSLTMEQVELDTIMGSISDAILAVDPEGNPLFFNSRFEVLFGDGGLRMRNIKLWGIFRDPEVLEAFTGALREGKVGATKAVPLDQKGGLRNYFSLSVSPLRRHDGTIYGAVGIFHDVTQLKSAEQMRIDFVANVSHELRTPLTSIKGYVDTLIEDVKMEKPVETEFLSIISRNSERLMNLMNDLLDLSAIESDDLLFKDAVDPRELTEKIIKQLEAGISKKRHQVATEYVVDTVVADPQRLEQVLINLLDNAVKYTPEGGNVRITWAPDGNDVLLKIWNDGPPIPIDHHPRLFERFYRIDKARSREQGGTGLGLAIVKHILQKHGGTVWVESKQGEGTVFICRFPGQTLPSTT